MPSNFVGGILATGQLPNVKATLYTVPPGTRTYIKFINAVTEIGGGSEAVELYVKKAGGTSRVLGFATLAAREQERFIEKSETLVLDAGDVIEGNTTTADTVDYTISGIEENYGQGPS